MPAHLDHVTLVPSDLAAGLAFYDAVLGALGLVRIDEHVDVEEDDPPPEAVGWGVAGAPEPHAVLWAVVGNVPTTGLHIRFQVDSRVDVETFYAAARAAGGTGHSAPRRWVLYRRGEFNAIVRDPDGNLVEAVSTE